MQARIWYRKSDLADAGLDSMTKKEGAYEIHDGYVKVRMDDDERTWQVLPMHRVVWIDLFS